MDAESVVVQFAPALSRIVASYERDRSLQDDLLQEVLMAVMTSLHQLESPSKLRPFVFRIAHNRCLSYVAKRMRERMREVPFDDSASDNPSHDEILGEAQQAHRLLEAVRSLELPYRQVMTLLLEGMSYEEIAETLGISLANVGVRVNRGKQRLKAKLTYER